MNTEEIKNKTVRSVVALTGRTIILQLINFFTFNFLAAYLGLVLTGIYFTIAAIRDTLNYFIDVGIGAAVIQQKREASNQELSSVFWVQLFLTAMVVVVGFLITGSVRNTLSLTIEGVYLYWALLFVLFLNSFKVIPSILLERGLEFEKQVLPQFAEAIIFNVLVVFFAFKGFGLYSYVYGAVASSIVGLVLYYKIKPFFPGFTLSLTLVKPLISYGLQYQAKSYISVVKDQLLIIFVAANKSIGPAGVGAWQFAQRWAYSPFRFIVDNTTKVSFPAFSRIAEKEKVVRGVEKSLFFVSLLLFPALIYIALFGTIFVNLIPRLNQYVVALPSLYILCFQAGLSAWSNILVNVLDASGRVKTTLLLMIFWTAFTWTATIFLSNLYGVTGVSLAALLVSTTVFITFLIVKRHFNFSVIKSLRAPVIAAGLMIFSTSGFYKFFPHGLGYAVLNILIGGTIYLLSVWILAKNEVIMGVKHVISSYSHS
jgi:PST family polysaccharide transporter